MSRPTPPDRLPKGVISEAALPLYGHTAARLVADMMEGGARPGDRLPSERLLAERYGVSRVTLRTALGQLSERGIVTSQASRGWFVGDLDAERPATDSSGPAVKGFADFAADNGLSVKARVMRATVRPATFDEAGTFKTAPGAAIFDLYRLRYLDGLVVVAEHNRVPLQLCPRLAEVDFATASLYATLRQSTPPQLPRRADYAVEARSPSAEEAALLEIEGPVPLLVARQLSYNQEGRPMELTVAAYRGDRYHFTASITNRD